MGTRKVSKMWIMALLLVGFTAGCGEQRGVATPTLTSISPTGGAEGQTLARHPDGNEFHNGSHDQCERGADHRHQHSVTSSTQITATFAIAANAVLGAVNISVTSSGMTTNAVTFTIGPPLAVSSVIPANGATGVPINQAITVTFNQAVNCGTITSSNVIVKGSGGAVVAGTLACTGTTATFTPTTDLAINSNYTATVTTGVTDSGGAALGSNYVWNFRTGSTPGTTPPTVTAVTPFNNATGVALNTAITAAFDEAMTPATMTAMTFTLAGPGATSVGGTIAYNSTSNVVTSQTG